MTDSPAKITVFDFSKIKNMPAETVRNWGTTLIVAPHPDDESLGCGGAIALLRKFNLSVYVLTLSDGTLSHPNSKKYPKEKLRHLRENEMLNALQILDVSSHQTTFLRWSDRNVPQILSPDFNNAVSKIKNYLSEIQPQTILVPWRFDPHPDHQAAWQLITAASKNIENISRIIEYPIWLWEMAEISDLPNLNEINIWRLDIQNVIQQKQAAILAHLSQVTDLIDDDPTGFRLSKEVLAHFSTPYEVYLEEIK